MCKALEQAGWVLVRRSGSHHIYERPGSPLSLSVPVHGNRDLSPGVQRTLMREAGLNDADL
jgi:predicted RNA binding protein YcfA (HicA-like mRNA interferase family)